MYRSRDMWDDAHRVAKTHGGATASQQVAYLWAKHLGGDSAVKLLQKLNAVDVAIDFACEQQAFGTYDPRHDGRWLDCSTWRLMPAWIRFCL